MAASTTVGKRLRLVPCNRAAVVRHLRRPAKAVLGRLRRPVPPDRQTILFILGCQRSGTTLMTRIFDRDWQASVYHENSPLSAGDRLEGLRLGPLDEVAKIFAADRQPFLVAKPLVESQNAQRLLEHFTGARALWLYRPVQDVAASDLRLFGERNGIDNIRPIAAGDAANWRAEHASAETRAIVARHFADDMPVYDAAALFWLARNRLFFEVGLDRPPWRDRVLPLRYEALTHDPEGVMRRVYAFVCRPFPRPRLVREVHQESVGKGRTVPLSAAIEALCQDLLARLDALSGYRQPVG